jgi:hypothetical protein
VNATFIGVHGHDHRLPDYTEEGVLDRLVQIRALLEQVESLETAEEGFGQIDRRLAEGHLRIQLWELESGHFLQNPSTHVGEAVFGMMSLLLSASASTDLRRDALAQRMEAIPKFLDQARLQLPSAPSTWTKRALRECRGALLFLTDGVARLEWGLAKESALAAGAFREFARFLETMLPDRPESEVACGPEAFDLLLRNGHFLERSADEIAEYARAEMAKAESWLGDAASDFGAEAPAEVLATLQESHPSESGYLSRYQEIWDEMKVIAEERQLVTWPDFPIRYIPRPAWARAAAPDLYFLFYRSPAAFQTPQVHDYLVTPIDGSVPESERADLLRSHHDSVIKLNHVVHHGGIGHHIQNWHAFRSPSQIGRIAAVDCAARIAMCCGATMAEGWACYATDVMAEAGGLTARE